MFSRYRIVRQNERANCGAAALATLGLYHGIRLPLDRLRELAGTSIHGVSLLGLMRSAENVGFAARAVRANLSHLQEIQLPAIAHVVDEVGYGHFVVVFRTRKGRVLIGDPAGGLVWTTHEEFQRRWTGNLLLAYPQPQQPIHPLGKQRTAWQRFLELAVPHRGILCEVVVCALLMTLLATLTSFFIQHLVDSVLVRMERSLLNALGIGMALVVIFRVVFSFLRQYFLMHVGRKVDLRLMGAFQEHLPRLPMRFFESRQSGEILARLTDAGKIRDVVQGEATSVVVDVLVIFGVLFTLWLYDMPLALVTTLLVPVFLLAVLVHHPAAVRRTHEAMEQGAKLAGHLIEDVSSIETMKVLNAQQRRTTQGQQRLVNFVSSIVRLQQLDLQVGQIALFIGGLASIGVLWLGAHRVMDGELSIGQLMFFFTMLSTVLEPLSRLATVNLKIQDAFTAMTRIYQVMDHPPEPATEEGRKFCKLTRQIELRDLCFEYETNKPVLRNINITIPAGKCVAVVGESGSGKSTLLKLLLRLYSQTSGQILVDGVDLRDFELNSVRQAIGVVPQDPHIYNGSVRENLLLASAQASAAEMADAIEAAQLATWVNGLPQRYDSQIGERGSNLSGGQRQRLAIARVLLANPDILVFDEATSHLDTATEQAIQHALRCRLAGRTVIMVAHRLSTVRHADCIVVMERGQVIEQGTHSQLLALRGRYAELWRAQHGQPESDSPRTLPACISA